MGSYNGAWGHSFHLFDLSLHFYILLEYMHSNCETLSSQRYELADIESPGLQVN
jgi:hypothetical protein